MTHFTYHKKMVPTLTKSETKLTITQNIRFRIKKETKIIYLDLTIKNEESNFQCGTGNRHKQVNYPKQF